MIVQLIPFFLAANMSSEDVSSWSKGPELEFDVAIRVKLDSVTVDVPSASSNMTFKFRCRPKETDTLSCRLEDGTARIETTNSDRVHTFERSKTNYIDLKFNEDGIESITADGETNCEDVNMMKRIPGVLSIGANLKEQDPIFETQEETQLGRCTTSIYLIRTTRQDANEDHPPNLHLIVTPLEMPIERTTIEISKVRDPVTCNGTGTFFEYSLRENTTIQATHAVSNMTITSPGTFKTNSYFRGDVANEFGNETIGIIEEFTELELVSIKEATDNPHLIANPSVHSPAVSSCLP